MNFQHGVLLSRILAWFLSLYRHWNGNEKNRAKVPYDVPFVSASSIFENGVQKLDTISYNLMKKEDLVRK